MCVRLLQRMTSYLWSFIVGALLIYEWFSFLFHHYILTIISWNRQRYWLSSRATEHTKVCHGYFDWLYPKTLSIKNRYRDRKVRESLEVDMAAVRYGQDKALNRSNGNFVKTNVWKPLLRKMKTFHLNLMSFCIKWRFCVVLWSV